MKEFFETIFLLASIQGVLLSIALFFRKQNHTANIFLSIVIFALSLELLSTVYYSKGWYITHVHLAGFTYPVALTYGPLFFLYVRFLTKATERFCFRDMIHFIPIVIVYLILLPVFFYPAGEKLAFVEMMMANKQPFIYDIIETFVPVQGVIYTIAVAGLVLKYNDRIKENYSNIEKINLDWLKYLTFAMIFCWLTVAVSHVVDMIVNTNQSFGIVLHTAISIIIYSVGYLNLSQPEIFMKPKEIIGKDEAPVKYKKSGLDNSSAKEIKEKLINVMEEQKPYLDSDLTLNKLAEIISVSGHHLSEVINSEIGKSYYDFINEYRVEEFINKLKDPSTANYSLISIAFDSGFKSKTSFNTIFKKHTGKTPSEYKSSISL